MDYREQVLKYQSILTVNQIFEWNEIIMNPDSSTRDLELFVNKTQPSRFFVESKIRGLENESSDLQKRLEYSEKYRAPETHKEHIKNLIVVNSSQLEKWDLVYSKLYK